MHNLITALNEWALTHWGIVIQEHQLKRVEQQARHLMHLHTMDESSFITALNNEQEAILKATVNTCTVQESYFFRDSSLFFYLKNTLLPELIAQKRKLNDYQLTIWSAGCANGEEIYSLAIYLDLLLPDINKWKIKLSGTDINEFALAKGRTGIYSNSSMRATDELIKNEYFDYKPPLYYLKKHICDRVTFSFSNIATMLQSTINYDLIFCRNVFIYLNKDTITHALKVFYESLVDNGLLFLGPSDLTSYYHHDFQNSIINGIFILKKKIPKVLPLQAKKPQSTIKPFNSSPYSKLQEERSVLLYAIRCAMDNKKYLDVLKNTDLYFSKFAETALLYRYKGEALIGLGDIDMAVVYLAKSIKLDPLDPHSHFITGLIEVDKKNTQTATTSFQKALYLKHNFVEAAYYLGLMHLQNNEHAKGVKCLQQALVYANDQPADKLVVCTNEHIDQFIKAIEASISYYQGLHRLRNS